MNILHFTLGIPQLRSGGLVSYAYSVAEEQAKKGNKVTLLYPGNVQLGKRKTYVKKKMIIDGVEVYKIVNPSFVAVPLGVKEPFKIMQCGNRKIYSEFLDTVSPDIVHVHTFMGIHRVFLEEVKLRKIPLIYTTHDYYPVCPKTSRINEKNLVCEGAEPGKCAICNAKVNNSGFLQYVLQSEWYPIIKKSKLLAELKKKRKNVSNETKPEGLVEEKVEEQPDESVVGTYTQLLDYQKEMFGLIDVVHCNSALTEKIFSPYLNGKKHFILNITTKGIEDKRNKEKVLPYTQNGFINIGYIGIRDYHKGHWLLKEAGKVLYDEGFKFKINLYGDEFEVLQEEYPFCESCGIFKHEELSDVMDKLDMLVVPGYWYETFGFSALEAIANGVPVLVSSHTGSKDLLQDVSTPQIFEPTVYGLCNLLRIYITNPELLKKSIGEQRNIKLVCSMEEHVEQLMKKIEKELDIC